MKQDFAPEVVHSYANNAPELVQPGLQVQHPSVDKHPYVTTTTPPYYAQHVVETPRQKRLCGFQLTTFWLSMALIVAIAAAIAAGAAAGELHAQSKTNCAAAVASPASNSTPPSNTTTTIGNSNSSSSSSSTCNTTLTSTCLADAAASNSTIEMNATQNKWSKFCGAYLSIGPWNATNLFTSYARSLDECIANCDSYNYWTGTSNATTSVWDYQGETGHSPGTCWCSSVPDGRAGNYGLLSTPGQDAAKLTPF